MNREQHARLKAIRDQIDALLQIGGEVESQSASNFAVDQQRFSFQDGAHRMKAEALFDEFEINEGRRRWFYNKTLEGVPLGQLRAVIEREDAVYRRKYPPRQRSNGRSGQWRQ